jgi:hypothetical protein
MLTHLAVSPAQLPHDMADKGFRIAKEHKRVIEIIKRVINPGKTGIFFCSLGIFPAGKTFTSN